MLTDVLKEQTRKTHDAAESNFDFKAITQSRELYITALKSMFGFYKPIEKILLEYELFFTPLGINLRERLKTPLIRRDLNYFGVSEKEMEEIPFCENLPDVSDFYRAMGCLYVLEGSTLGGQIIAKELVKSGLSKDGEGKAYYDPYETRTMPMFLQLKEALNKLPDDKESVVLEAAQETFKTFGSWLGSSMKKH